MGVLQLVCALLATGYGRAEPSVLPYTLLHDYPVFQARGADGKVEKYLLSLSASVNLRFSNLTDEHGRTQVSSLEIANTKKQSYSFRVSPHLFPEAAINGIIGVDFFRNQTVGFDFESKQLFLWDEEVDSASVNGWGRSLRKWLYIGRASYELTELPLETGDSALPTLKVAFGGAQTLALLASSISGNALAQELVAKTAPPGASSAFVLSRSVSHPNWKPGILEFETGRNLHQSGVPTTIGIRLAIGSINSKLAVIDLRSRRLWIEKLPRHAADSLLLSRLLGMNVFIETGHLKLGSVSAMSSASKYEGSVIKWMGKVSPEALLAPLRSDKDSDLARLMEAIRATEDAKDLVLKYPGGEEKIPLRTVKW